MDGSIVSEIQLNVSLARRQPQIGPTTDAPSSAAWATLGKNIFSYTQVFHRLNFFLASSHSQKGNHRDNREMINYDEMDLFD